MRVPSCLLLRPESFLDPDALLGFLRHELFHIIDMLNPDFAYEPTLPQSEGGPVYDRLLRDRYRVLWDTTINGRLLRRGWISSSVRERCLRDFVKVFPMLGACTVEAFAEAFARFFDTDRHTHTELVAFACNPDGVSDTPSHGGRCPLCRFPTYAFESEPERMSAAVTARIHRDFPAWQPSQGLCPQCADLYRAQPLSTAAVQQLPRG
jgi:hypothetical protein